MKWIYHEREKWMPDNKGAFQTVYMRPRVMSDYGEELEGLIIDIHIISLGFFFEKKIFTKDERPEYFSVLTTKLNEKDYYFEFIEVPESSKEIYLNWARLFIIDTFDKEIMQKWLKLYLAVMGYPCDELVKGDYADFADTNPIMQIFSLDNVKKFEGQLGKEWWVRDKEEKECESKPTEHQSDNDLIEDLLKEIKSNKN